MKSSRRTTDFSSSFSSNYSSSVVTYRYRNDETTPTHSHRPKKTTQIPIHSPPSPPPAHYESATKIQSAYRSHRVRALYKRITAVNCEADALQRLIQRQETVDAVRSDARERIKLNEALMALLLRLDSVPGFDPTVRELRRSVSRRIVGLQEVVDAVVVGEEEEYMKDWDDVVKRMEEDVFKDRGVVYDYELERFCALHFGFRCFHRFLRHDY